jgi:hypothetical protein
MFPTKKGLRVSRHQSLYMYEALKHGRPSLSRARWGKSNGILPTYQAKKSHVLPKEMIAGTADDAEGIRKSAFSIHALAL